MMKWENRQDVGKYVIALAFVACMIGVGVLPMMADNSNAEAISCNFYAADPTATDLTDGSSAYHWVSGTTTNADGTLTLPGFTGEVPDGYVFYGWTGYYWTTGIMFAGTTVVVDSADHSNFKAVFLSADLPLKSSVSVSSIGLADGCASANNGMDFGPDTEGTTTCGIQEAINAVSYVNQGILNGNLSISDDKASGTIMLSSGTFQIESEIVLAQGTVLTGSGRLSTAIALNDTPGDWLADMRAAVVIPANANECRVSDMSIIGFRTEGYQPYSTSGILIQGYNWRAVIEDVEIVDFQGSGIETVSSSSDPNAVVYEPIFDRVSVISCYNGMTLVSCADDALYSVNLEHCSGDGIRYYGGNGKWVDVHVYNNNVGMRIAGQPLRIVACSLDTNILQGAIVESIDMSISPGAVVFEAPMSQGNGRNAPEQYACAILIEGQNVIVNDLISINKPSDPYQKWGVVEVANANNNHVNGLISAGVSGEAHMIGKDSTWDGASVDDTHVEISGAMILCGLGLLIAIAGAVAKSKFGVVIGLLLAITGTILIMGVIA